MLSEPGASVTHSASHAELAWGKPPPRLDPALGLHCSTALGVCTDPSSLCLLAAPSGCRQGPPPHTPPVLHGSF